MSLLQALFHMPGNTVYCLLQQNRKLKMCIRVDNKIIELILWHVRSRESSQNKEQMMWTPLLTSPKV
jgi:hypothetical protein